MAAVIGALSFPGGVAQAQTSPASTTGGAVFGMTNGLLGNSVTAFRRDGDGRVKRSESFSTGGRGSGVLEITDNGWFVFTSNFQSGDISRPWPEETSSAAPAAAEE